MNTDKLNTDFMDIQAIALAESMGDEHKRREIIMITRQFKDHLADVEAALRERLS
jgi:hypothetical protein